MKLNLLSVFERRLFWAIALLICIAAGFFLIALERAVLISNVHVDGVYQTASALMRVAHGDAIGRDFYFYLGIGPLYTLYPLFSAFGGDVAASIVASHFVVMLSFLITLILFSRLVFSGASWASVILIAIVLSWVLEYFFVEYGFYFRYPNYFTYLDPGNSLRPLRRFAPVLGAILICLASRLKGSQTRVVAYGVIAGTLANWSNDYGVPTAIATLLFVLWETFQKKSGATESLKELGLFCLVALAWSFLLLALITEGYVREWLHYNFEGISKDQWWYYKPYLKERIWQFSDLGLILSRGENWPLTAGIVLTLLLLPTLLLFSLLERSINSLLMFYVGTCLVGGALISEVFGHLDDYYWAGVIPWLLFAILMAWVRLLRGFDRWVIRVSDPNLSKNLLSFVYAVVVLLSVTRALGSFLAYTDSVQYHRAKDNYVAELGGYVDAEDDTNEYLAYMEAQLSQSGGHTPQLVEEYFGLASALQLSKSPVPFDSAIHALGNSARALYLKKLEQADFVTTTNPTFSRWQAWGLSQNWWFYRYVIENFSPLKRFDNVVVWERTKASSVIWDQKEISCELERVKEGYLFKINPLSENEPMVELSFEYSLNKSFRRRALVVVENGLAYENHYTSLNLSDSSAWIPVHLIRDLQANGVKLHVLPNGNDDRYITVDSCHVRIMKVDAENINFDDRYIPLELDLDEFIGGLHTASPIFYVLNSEANKTAYRGGARIQFANGEIRTVVRVKEHFWGDKLEVEYDGPSLAKEKVGYPNKINVVER